MVVALMFGGGEIAVAQSADEIQALRRAVEQLRESQQRIEKELAEIKGLLRGRQAAAPPEDDPKSVALSIDATDPVKGDQAAKLVLVEFTDYQ